MVFVCLSHRQKTNRLNTIYLEPASGLSFIPLFYIPEDAHQGSCLITAGSIRPALGFCLLVQFSYPCHLQDSAKIVRGMPVGGTLCVFLHCFSLKFLFPCLGTLQYLHGMLMIYYEKVEIIFQLDLNLQTIHFNESIISFLILSRSNNY